MARTLSYDDVLHLCAGACVLASGGGGSYTVAKQTLQQGVQPGQRIQLVDVDDVPPQEWLCACAYEGAPEGFVKMMDPFAASDAVKGLVQYLQGTGSKAGPFTSVCPIEVGAINSAAALCAGAQLGLAVVNADGAGRSIPAPELLTFTADGCDCLPLCITSNRQGPGGRYKAVVDTLGSNPEQSSQLPGFALRMFECTNDTLALATYPMPGEKLKSCPPVMGTLWDALRIGQIVTGAQGELRASGVVAYLAQRPAGARIARVVFHGYITSMTEQPGGTDVGHVTVAAKPNGTGDTLAIIYKNENLYAEWGSPAKPIIVGPDSICYIPARDTSAGQPVIDNTDLWQLYNQPGYQCQPLEVYVVAVDVPAIVRQKTGLMKHWHDLLAQCGYTGKYVQPWLHS